MSLPGDQPQLGRSSADDVSSAVAVEPWRREVDAGADAGDIRQAAARVGVDTLDTSAAHLADKEVCVDIYS